MVMVDSERKCPSCQSKKLQYGIAGAARHTFRPNGKMMFIGYDVGAYVCLDCGTVGYYVSNSDVQSLREFQEKKKKQI